MENIVGYFEFFMIYTVLVIGKAALLTIPVLALIFLLRATLFRSHVFGRGFLWMLMLLVPFMGKMKWFYESIAGWRIFFWQHELCVTFPWICSVYVGGMVGFFLFFVRRRRKLQKTVRGFMRVEPVSKERLLELGGRFAGRTDIRACDYAVTPFAVGLLHPVIVLPRNFLEKYSKEELEVILLHELTHIRMLHLWYYFLWDVLRAMFWINPAMLFATKYIRLDLELICDCVCIQKQNGQAVSYGMLILKTARVLGNRPFPERMPAFAGEKEFRGMKERIRRIAEYEPYRQKKMMAVSCCVVAVFLGVLMGIRENSYPKYTRIDTVSFYSEDFRQLMMSDEQELRDAFWYRDGRVYIDWNQMNPILNAHGIRENSFYLGFGGFVKLPGVGGGCNAIFVERASDGVAEIPYVDNEKLPMTRLAEYF